MEVIKILSNDPWQEFRCKLWSEFAIKIEWLEGKDDQDANYIISDLDKPTYQFDSFSKKTSSSMSTGSYDFVVRDKQGLWPELLVSKAIREMIIERTPLLDTHGWAYLTGGNGSCLAAWDALVQIGFRRFAIVARDHAKLTKVVDSFKRNFFDLEVLIIRDIELSLQPNNGTVLVNTEPDDHGLIQDLAYLNFLKNNGLVIEMYNKNTPNDLILEAVQAGNKLILGSEIVGLRDWHILGRIGVRPESLSKREYLDKWNLITNTEIAQNKT